MHVQTFVAVLEGCLGFRVQAALLPLASCMFAQVQVLLEVQMHCTVQLQPSGVMTNAFHQHHGHCNQGSIAALLVLLLQRILKACLQVVKCCNV
jgi:hypothetical protein